MRPYTYMPATESAQRHADHIARVQAARRAFVRRRHREPTPAELTVWCNRIRLCPALRRFVQGVK